MENAIQKYLSKFEQSQFMRKLWSEDGMNRTARKELWQYEINMTATMTILDIDNDCDIDDYNSDTEGKHIWYLWFYKLRRRVWKIVLLWYWIQMEDDFLAQIIIVWVCCSINCN